MVYFRYRIVNTLHEGDNRDDDDDGNNNNNVRRDNSRPMYWILSVLFIKRYLLAYCTE
jgi:hypothetical protein